jgi:hypothetical protein
MELSQKLQKYEIKAFNASELIYNFQYEKGFEVMKELTNITETRFQR